MAVSYPIRREHRPARPGVEMRRQQDCCIIPVMPPLGRLRLLLPTLLLVLACGPLRNAAESLLDSRTPRERYEDGLESAGLGASALAVDWSNAATRALDEAASVPPSHVEEGFLPPSDPTALAYRISLRRGQKVSFEFALQGDSTAQIFVDVWQITTDTSDALRHVAAADSGQRSITFGPRRDGDFIVRAQPELLRGGRFTASLRVLPTLGFPVLNGSERDIGSVYGDARDGGRRSHHGIDIFAPRGTPVIAAAPGTIQRVETTPVGGNVVWMRDTLGNRLYYAHLDSQNVNSGDRVEPGDTLGFVGNTGNARTTPPHLHFGVYSRGPVDPYYFVHLPRAAAQRLLADTTLIGEWARVAQRETALRSAPSASADLRAELPKNTAMRLIAASGSWYRVRLPDGSTGYVASSETESATSALRSAQLDEGMFVLARPVVTPVDGDILALAGRDSSLRVVAHFGDFALVRGEGLAGWIALQ